MTAPLTPSLIGGDGHLLAAEQMLPGHPDKLSDQIADGVLDIALIADPNASVQVEVAVHEDVCFVSGRCATSAQALDPTDVELTIRAVYDRAGFGGSFPAVGDGDDYQCPRNTEVRLSTSLQLEVAGDAEIAEREYADDQAIHIGYAVATPETRFLPLEQHLALALRDRLLALTLTRRDLGAGPDGKLVVTLRATGGGAPRYEVCDVVVSVQHLDRAPLVQLERAVREMIFSELAAQHLVMPHLVAEPSNGLSIRFNRGEPFVRGGPMNDNGQTGRKLVCDLYGPRVPLGGGALSGKDPWRLDRAGTLRARQIALAMVATGFVQDALVTFVWAPRDARPSHVAMLCEGKELPSATVSKWLKRIDPSLRATWEELGLHAVNYENCARGGHFGRGMPWDIAP